jgi:hypothetical protein
MNNEKKYTAADFASYHAGTMPAQDMHVLEKAALEDPFLADALEGYVHTTTAVADVEALKGKFATKEKSETKVFALSSNKTWMRAAASVVIVLGLGYLFYTINKKEEAITPLAKNEIKQELKTDTFASEKSEAEFANNTPQVPTASATIATVKSNTITFTDVKPNLDSTTSSLAANEFSVTSGTYIQQAPAAPATTTMEAPATQTEWAKVSENKIEDNQNIKEVHKDLNSNNRSQNNTANYYNYNGVVQNPAGGPMQNATVKLKNTNIVTQTDDKGRFNFKATDSVANVSIAALGYDKKEAQLNSNATQILRLDNKNSHLDEVVVTSVGAKRKSANVGFSTTRISDKALAGKVSGVKVSSENDTYETLKKVKGIQIDSSKYNLEAKSFYNFVKQNIKPEFDEFGNEYKGNVVLSFTVNKKGDTRKIRVEKSLNEKCDAQAIQLLETGPSWYFPAGERRTVVIEF